VNEGHNAGVDRRESIWSIPASRRTLYFGLFAVQTLAGAGLVCWYEIGHRTETGAVETVLGITQGISTVAVAAAAMTVAILEAWGFVMVVGDWLADKLEERKLKRLEAARSEAWEQWEAWNQRRIAAEAAGEPFTEQPPSLQ
jgi:hypothetical protein